MLMVQASHAQQFMLHTRFLVSRTPYDFTNTEVNVSWASSWVVKLMASNEEKLRRRWERDRLRRQTETAREREVPSKLEGLLISILAQRAPASGTCAMHQYSKCCSLQLRVFPVILSSWSLLAKMLYTCGLYLFHNRLYAFYMYIIIQAYKVAQVSTLFTYVVTVFHNLLRLAPTSFSICLVIASAIFKLIYVHVYSIHTAPGF